MTTYRELGPDEVIEPLDEFEVRDGEWRQTYSPGITGAIGVRYRRPITDDSPPADTVRSRQPQCEKMTAEQVEVIKYALQQQEYYWSSRTICNESDRAHVDRQIQLIKGTLAAFLDSVANYAEARAQVRMEKDVSNGH